MQRVTSACTVFACGISAQTLMHMRSVKRASQCCVAYHCLACITAEYLGQQSNERAAHLLAGTPASSGSGCCRPSSACRPPRSGPRWQVATWTALRADYPLTGWQRAGRCWSASRHRQCCALCRCSMHACIAEPLRSWIHQLWSLDAL